MFEGADVTWGASVGETVSQRGAKSVSQRVVCEGRENRGSMPLEEGPKRVTGLRAQFIYQE